MNRPVILLFGMPRSGTTWIAKLFDSHPATLYRHEPDSHLPLELPLLVSGQGSEYCEKIRRYVKGLWHCRLPAVTTKRPMFSKDYLPVHRVLLYRGSAYLSMVARRLHRRFQLPIYDPLRGGEPDRGVLVWKSIESVGRLGVISRCLESCRGLHIIRHPCGYVSSVLAGEEQGHFSKRCPTSESYRVFGKLLDTETGRNYGLTLERLEGLSPIRRLAWHWVLFNEHALRETAAQENCMTVRYEDLCLHPERSVRHLFAFCGLQWHPQTAAFLRASTGHDDGSYYGVHREPWRAAFRWRERLDEKQIEAIQEVVQESRLGSLYQDMVR